MASSPFCRSFPGRSAFRETENNHEPQKGANKADENQDDAKNYITSSSVFRAGVTHLGDGADSRPCRPPDPRVRGEQSMKLCPL